MTVTEHIRKHFLAATGYRDPPVPLIDLYRSERSPSFEAAARHRKVVGRFRYGAFGADGKPSYARVEAIAKRAEEYAKTGNDELLVDIRNLAELEWEEGTHPRKHWAPIDDGEHVQTTE